MDSAYSGPVLVEFLFGQGWNNTRPQLKCCRGNGWQITDSQKQ